MLKEYIKDKKMNIKQLSDSSGVGYNYVYKIVNNLTPIDNCGLGTVRKLANALDITIDKLYEICTTDYVSTDNLNIAYYIKAAQHSRYNSQHWFRYLRKIFNENECKLTDDEINQLLSSNYLTMYQKVVLKRAVIKDSKTNKKIVALNQKAKTPMIDQIKRKYNVQCMKLRSGREQDIEDVSKIITKLEIPSPKEFSDILVEYKFTDIDESLILESFGKAYGMEWLEKYYIENIESLFSDDYIEKKNNTELDNDWDNENNDWND